MNEPATQLPQAQPDPSMQFGRPPIEPPAPAQKLAIEFTGTGGEYFRIWIVNLLLTIVTLGIYSAWAKVRKTRFFWTNTRLDGAAFQYRGRPAAILRGRILVGILAAAYSLAGRISVEAAVVAALVLAVLSPWLFFKAMRFKLTNTTWRGVRFGFDSTVGAAYATLAPAVILWAMFAAEMATLRPGTKATPSPYFALVYLAIFALVPWMHARIKAYQHRAATWGTQRFDFDPSTGAFYKLYGKTFLVGFLPLAGVMAVVGGVLATKLNRGPGAAPPNFAELLPIFAAVYAAMIVAYLVPGAFFSARLQRLVWARTHGGPFQFSSSVTMRGFLRVWLKNGLLTILTLGLYWPWAAVNLARYKLLSMTVETAVSPGTVAATAQDVEPSAAGDGAVDFFGWDFGL